MIMYVILLYEMVDVMNFNYEMRMRRRIRILWNKFIYFSNVYIFNI